MQLLDVFIIGFDRALRVSAGMASATRPNPAAKMVGGALSVADRQHSAGLMRINHVGEVCAQALYAAQGRFAGNDSIKKQFEQAGHEEADHLAWTAQRLTELGASPSVLNPVWYAGAYALGAVAAHLGDARSLGFVVETERQVEAHLASHLITLPEQDTQSRAIVEQMRLDEVAHGAAADGMGAVPVAKPVRALMTLMAKMMTATAYYI